MGLALFLYVFIANAFFCRAFSQNTNAIPPQLQEAVAKGLLVQPRPNIFVLGTVHLGSESAEEASILVDYYRPRTVVVEVSASRLPLIRKRNESNKEGAKEIPSSSSSNQIQTAIGSLPALAQKGWSTGGLNGLIFATTIVWGSLLKRSVTANEESDKLPRVDEFAATIKAADAIGASIVASDVEIDELLASVARAMTPMDWIALAGNIAKESIGLQEADPIRRKTDESIIEWTERRRNIATARASRAHGEETAPCISRALVNERDEKIAESCLEALELRDGDSDGITVCVVGLVHLDGVAERLNLKAP